jgi:hypothetical protein
MGSKAGSIEGTGSIDSIDSIASKAHYNKATNKTNDGSTRERYLLCLTGVTG